MQKTDVDDLLLEYHVSTEDELYRFLIMESNTLPCIICGEQKNIDELEFSTGDPCCKEHLK
jgi:hypothetical protein